MGLTYTSLSKEYSLLAPQVTSVIHLIHLVNVEAGDRFLHAVLLMLLLVVIEPVTERSNDINELLLLE